MDKVLPNLVDSFLDSYHTCGGINHIDGANLPSKAMVDDFMRDLLRLMFPGFHHDNALNSTELPGQTVALIGRVHMRLIRETEKALCFKGDASNCCAETIVTGFMQQLPELRKILHTDVEAAMQGDPAATSMDEIIVAYPGIEAVAVQRMAHILYDAGVPMLPRMMTEWAHSRTGIDIHPGATIGTHFFIDHGTGVVIGETSEIGNHVRIYQGVGLVGRSIEENVKRDGDGKALVGKRHPTIGNYVTVYSGATILGGDTTIGDRCIIGGNVWVTHSIPPDTVVYFSSSEVQMKPRNKQIIDFQI